ncbi:MAG: extracellular solute-binding protein, partial [Oscillospiraceae bacterium]|nr:extracellular solute-binding protein [Oscillospiraceae bacterium]
MKFRRIMASILAASTMLSFAACSGNETSGTSSTSDAGNTSTSDTSKTDTSDAGTSTSTSDAGTTEKLTLKVLTCRTDRVEDGSLDEYTDAFEAANNCIVEYQGYTDYESDVSTMMNTTEYGDVLMIPGTVKLADLGNFFEPLGTYDEMSQKYNWVDAKMYDNTVYGLPIWGGVSGGICYNKRIWSEAGVTELPKTPEEFLAALKLIEQNTDAIPYYTNYADASWTLVQWAALVNSASGSSTYEQDILKAKRDLFVDGDAYYEVYELMFDIFSDPTLIEEDPMTPDWEGCKKAINDGKIATMVMGSWAVSQFKEAGENPDDIGY